MTVVSIGSTVREQREVDEEVIARADVVIADMLAEVIGDSGDLVAARAGRHRASPGSARWPTLVGGREPGRTSADEIVVYKSVGSAVQDLAVAAMCVRRAPSPASARHCPSASSRCRK